ncbi:MAG: phosphate ABC transporter substrate-binding protein [Porticoccaceae bacterium]|nr:phosphate ABC transporter substrate-binding protein [Porticoccaceae bacterium]
MNKLQKSLAAGALTTALVLASSANAELAIVVNPDYSGGNINMQDIRDLYQGKSKTLNDVQVKAVDQSSGSSARKQFLSTVLEKSESEMNRYWSRLIFSGKGRPPEVLDSADAIKRWIALNPEGIGYIDADDVDDTVKVLLKVTQ